jgi:hypothetical protein
LRSFFKLFDTAKAVDALAAAPELTVYVGAGASMEIGLPSWPALVRMLLDRAISDQGWADDVQAFRDESADEGLLRIAETVDALLGGGLEQELRNALYGNIDPNDLRPGPLARAIADLHAAAGPTMELGTTNYDPALEHALSEHPARGDRWWTRAKGYVRRREPPDGVVQVLHLHGILTAAGSNGAIILTEGDYYRMQQNRRWQEDWMVEALASRTCLFLGASLTDPNLLRYLHRAAGGPPRHFAVFQRRPASSPHEVRFRDRAEQAERLRWERLGVRALFADNLADVAQFVHEVADKRRKGAAYVPLVDRLIAWWTAELDRGCLLAADEGLYRKLQVGLHDELRGLRDDLRATLSNHGVDLTSETIAVALWALYPNAAGEDQERAVVLATSDRLMTDPATREPIRLDRSSSWTGIKAIANGFPQEEATNVYASRWRYVLAIPVFKTSPRLPLGAVTLSTMADAGATGLARLPAPVSRALDITVNRVAVELLSIGGGSS